MNHALHDLLLDRRRVVISKEIAANGGEIPEMFASDEVHFEITRALRSRRREAVSAAMVEHFDRWRRISRAPSPKSAQPAKSSQPAKSASPTKSAQPAKKSPTTTTRGER
jgi:GntR family transcriptional repressor for pyruvate dehydrogenase complex